MASTWSSLKFELIGTGEQAGTWGTTTNANLGDAIEQAIGGKADITMSSTSETLTLTDTTALQDARALYLNLSGTPGGAATLNVPAVEKAYIVRNGTNQQVTVKVTGQTGVVVPTGKVMALYDNGTDVVDTITHLTSLTLGSALPVASGGTGVTTSTGSGSVVLSTSPTLTTPNLGTPSAATLTNATGLPLSTGVTGQLPLANGGTGANLVDPNADRILFWDDSAGAVTFLSTGTGVSISGTTLSATGTGGTVTSVSGTGTVQGLTLSGTVTSSGSLTLGGSLSAVNLASQVTGTLPIGNGGTGAALVDPNADRILFWDDSAGATAFLATGTGLSISGTTISATNNGTVTSITAGTYLTGGTITTSGTIAVDATTTNTASKVVARDASGNFSAGTITASLSGNASTATSAATWTTSRTLTIGATGKSVNGSGNVTWTLAEVTGTTGTPQFGSLGVGTAASGTTGEIRATNNVTAYYSDERLKTKLGNIENALDKICNLSGFYYEANEVAQELGYKVEREVGVSAQEVQRVLPEVVVPAPISDKYLTVRYEKLVPLLIEAIKELKAELEALKNGA
jgi:hypothetical protein